MAKTKSATAQIDHYCATLAEFAQQNALHEGAVSTAFQSVATSHARPKSYILIALTFVSPAKHCPAAGWWGRTSTTC